MAANSGILVAVDGSPSANAAIRWAARDAELRHSSLTIVHAVAPVLGTWLAAPVPIDVLEWQHEIGRQVVADALQIAKESTVGSLEISTDVLSVPPVRGLVQMSKNADMVVVGSRGRGALASTVLGSVSMGLAQHAHCPVAVIHGEAPSLPPAAQAPVVVGVDSSPTSKAALALAFDEASRRRAELVALHAWWAPGSFELPGFDWDTLRAEIDKEFAEQLQIWQQRYIDVGVQRVVVRDQPARELVERSRPAQLIAVGSHGHGAIAGALLGSVSTAVVQAARIPVIIAR